MTTTRLALTLAVGLSLAGARTAAAQADFSDLGGGLSQLLMLQLDLTPEQEAEVQPVLDEHTEALRSIRERRQADEITRFAAIRELRAAGKVRDEKMEPLLTDEQWTTYQELQERIREGARERIQERMKSGEGR